MFEAAITVQADPEVVMRWLCEPSLMVRWIAGIDSVDLVQGVAGMQGAQTKLVYRSNRGITFMGEVIEAQSNRLERRCTLTRIDTRTGVESMPPYPSRYEARVVYALHQEAGSTLLRCTIMTEGQSQPAADRHAEVQRKSLQHSLDRLAALLSDSEPPSTAQRWWRRWVSDGLFTPLAL